MTLARLDVVPEQRRGSENAARFAEDLKPIIDDIREAGHTSVRAIAAELNQRGIRTARDRQWHPTSAARLLQRLDAA